MDLQSATLSIANAGSAAEVRAGKADVARLLNAAVASNAALLSRDAVEVLIPDSRAELSPAQSVERKLTSMLRGATIPVSHIRLARLCRNR